MGLEWNELKNRRLKLVRGKSFQDVIAMRLIGAGRHPHRPAQSFLLYEDRGYVWVVPYVMSDEKVFLKTLYASRKYTKMFQKGEL